MYGNVLLQEARIFSVVNIPLCTVFDDCFEVNTGWLKLKKKRVRSIANGYELFAVGFAAIII